MQLHSFALAGLLAAALSSTNAVVAGPIADGPARPLSAARIPFANAARPRPRSADSTASNCRALTLQDLTARLTDFQLARLVNYTDTAILSRLSPSKMHMFDLEMFEDAGAAPGDYNRTVSRWRADVGYWTSGGRGVGPATAGVVPKAAAATEDRAGGEEQVRFGEETTWYWDAVSEDEVEDLGYVPAQVCLDTASAVLEVVEGDNCVFERHDAQTSMNASGMPEFHLQQARSLTTTVRSVGGPAAADDLSAQWSGVVGSGLRAMPVELKVFSGRDAQTAASRERRIAAPVLVQSAQQQHPFHPTCRAVVESETCTTRLRLRTPLRLHGQLHVRSAPECVYNRDARGVCREDLLVDLGRAMEGFVGDAVVVQEVEAVSRSSRGFRIQCEDGEAEPELRVSVSEAALVATDDAETRPVEAASSTYIDSTARVHDHTIDLAAPRIHATPSPVNAAATVAATTVTVTRRPHASTTHVQEVVRAGTATVTARGTVTETRRVVATVLPTLCAGAEGGGRGLPMRLRRRDPEGMATRAAGGRRTEPAARATDSPHTTYRFGALDLPASPPLPQLPVVATQTVTVRETRARTITRVERVTRAQTTRTVRVADVTATAVWTMTVAPRCTYRRY